MEYWIAGYGIVSVAFSALMIWVYFYSRTPERAKTWGQAIRAVGKILIAFIAWPMVLFFAIWESFAGLNIWQKPIRKNEGK